MRITIDGREVSIDADGLATPRGLLRLAKKSPPYWVLVRIFDDGTVDRLVNPGKVLHLRGGETFKTQLVAE